MAHRLRPADVAPLLPLRPGCHLFDLSPTFSPGSRRSALTVAICPQGLSGLPVNLLGFDPMPSWGLVLGRAPQADLLFSRLSVRLLCGQHIWRVPCWLLLHQRSCRIDGFLSGELSLKKPLLYSVSNFRCPQSSDALYASPPLPPLRALASNFPLQETSAG